VATAILEAQIERHGSVFGAGDRRFGEVPTPNVDDPGIFRSHFGHHAFWIPVKRVLPELYDQPAERSDPDARDGAACCHRANRSHSAACRQNLATSPTAKLITVSPRREFRALRLADPNERRAIAQMRQADVVRGHSAPRVAIQLLCCLDGLPALV
jgi:hypothetical protein